MKLGLLKGDLYISAGRVEVSDGSIVDFSAEPWAGHNLLEVSDLLLHDRGVTVVKVQEDVVLEWKQDNYGIVFEVEFVLETSKEINEVLAMQQDPE